MEPVSAVSMTKEALSLKLETPFIVAAGIIGQLNFAVMAPGSQVPFRTPLEGLSKAIGWTGWRSGSVGVDATRSWMVDPTRVATMNAFFVLVTASGVAFAAYGTRAAFSALVGVGGLIETGSITQAWLVPLAAFVCSAVFMRLLPSDRYNSKWGYAGMSCAKLAMAWMYLPLAAFALVVGEPKPASRQTVDLELPLETQFYIDDRLKAFGMRSLEPSYEIPTISVSRPRPSRDLQDQ
ncbi:Uncharacterised protein [Mycobacteroides abscessus subsp. abscessus]|nr:Uncharacterised protein [Mycobacteroides abscessus subsp. abscessus]